MSICLCVYIYAYKLSRAAHLGVQSCPRSDREKNQPDLWKRSSAGKKTLFWSSSLILFKIPSLILFWNSSLINSEWVTENPKLMFHGMEKNKPWPSSCSKTCSIVMHIKTILTCSEATDHHWKTHFPPTNRNANRMLQSPWLSWFSGDSAFWVLRNSWNPTLKLPGTPDGL